MGIKEERKKRRKREVMNQTPNKALALQQKAGEGRLLGQSNTVVHIQHPMRVFSDRKVQATL
jgi:hypothetical protein